MSLKRTSALLLSGLVLLPLLLLALVLQLEPAVPQPGSISATETRALEQLIVDNSPDSLSSSGDRVIRLDEDELNLLAAFASNNVPQLSKYAARFSMRDSRAFIQVSSAWPHPRSPLYLNLEIEIAQQEQALVLQRLEAGRLPLPDFMLSALSDRLRQEMEALTLHNREFAALQHSIRHLTLRDDAVDIHLQWEPELLSDLGAHAQQLFLSSGDRERILYYFEQIGKIAGAAPADQRRVSLHLFLSPLFELALQRSRQGDPVAENRALLQALSLYINRLPVEQLAEGRSMPTLRQVNVALRRRDDLSQHFVSAAAIAASAGAGIAEVLSNSKEVYDARYRSGFNFGDLAANTAGMALGNAATGNEDSARRIQRRLAQAEDESEYMPSTEGLMTGLSEQDLADEYNDRDDPRYRSKIREIEALIAALPIYQGD